MPDGDIVRCQFTRRFLRPYKKLCLEQFDAQETAKAAARAVRETLKEYGDSPLQFLQTCSDYLQQHLSESSAPIDYRAASRTVDALAQQYSGNPRGMHLAKKAVRQELQALRERQGTVDREHMAQRYMTNVYQSEFAQRAPLARVHWHGQTHAEIENRLQQVQSHVEKHVERFAQKATASGSVDKLPLRRTRRPQKLGLHEELF